MPEGSTLTYETFAQPFFSSYCTHCHAANCWCRSHGSADGADFDTLRHPRHGHHVDQYAAAVPQARTPSCPVDPRPSARSAFNSASGWRANGRRPWHDCDVDRTASANGAVNTPFSAG